jgi:hypothetical protein
MAFIYKKSLQLFSFHLNLTVTYITQNPAIFLKRPLILRSSPVLARIGIVYNCINW